MKKNRNHLTLIALCALSFTIPLSLSAWIITGEKKFNKNLKDEATEDVQVAYIIDSNHQIKPTKYTSIERALSDAQSGEIVTLIPPKGANDSASTTEKVTYKISKNCVIKEGVTLVVPTDEASNESVRSDLNAYLETMKIANKDLIKSSSFSHSNPNKYLRVTLEIAPGVTVTNNGRLVVSGLLSGGANGAGAISQTAGSYSRIVMDEGAQIVQDNENAEICCTGYIEEKTLDNGSYIDVKNGEVILPLIIRDYEGFDPTYAMANKNEGTMTNHHVFVFNQIELQNIQSRIYISYNAVVTGIVNLYVKKDAAGTNFEKVFSYYVRMVGKDSNAKSAASRATTIDTPIIQFTNEQYSALDYKYNPTTEIADIHVIGGNKLNPLSITIKESIITIDVTTADCFFPLSYRWHITLEPGKGQDNAVFDSTIQRLKLLPGCEFTLKDGVTLNGKEIINYTSFYEGGDYNGKRSNYRFSAPLYPIKDGGKLVVADTAKINVEKIAGTVFCNNLEGQIVHSLPETEIVAEELWTWGDDKEGGLTQPYKITEYVQIREKLNLLPLEDSNKEKLYLGTSVFSSYSTFLPEYDVYVNGNPNPVTVRNGMQEVYTFDEINSIQVEFVSDVYRAYDGEEYYKKDELISSENTNFTFNAINSVIDISNNANGINEFDVQSVEIECKTPPVNDQIPLFVGKSIDLAANINNAEKAYDTTVTWTSSNPEIATVDNNGVVTGVSLGKTTITATVDGKSATFEATVLEEIAIKPVESIKIKDDKGNISDGTSATDGKYGNDTDIIFDVVINPSDAPYKSISWTFTASQAGRQYVKDPNHPEYQNQQKVTVEGQSNIIIRTTSGTKASDDPCTLTCTIVDYNGNEFKETFNLIHKADSCVLPDTFITMADGSFKKICEVTNEDLVLAFNHYTGQVEAQKISFLFKHEKELSKVIHLLFDDGTELGLVNLHSLFSFKDKHYIIIQESNYKQFVGQVFVKYDEIHKQIKHVKLVSAYCEEIETECYSVVTNYHLNCFTERILGMIEVKGLTDYFDMDDNLKVIPEKMEEDIKKYGLCGYDDYPEMPKRVFDIFQMQYTKVAFGKGITTKEELWKTYLDFRKGIESQVKKYNQ